MDSMVEFMALYEGIKGSRPLYLHIEEVGSGIQRWRVHIMEKDTAPHGDRELLCVEDPKRAECFRKAVEKIKALNK